MATDTSLSEDAYASPADPGKDGPVHRASSPMFTQEEGIASRERDVFENAEFPILISDFGKSRLEVPAAAKRSLANGFEGAAQLRRAKARTACECLGAEGRKRVGKGNVLEVHKIGERACGNCSDGSAVDGLGDGQVFR